MTVKIWIQFSLTLKPGVSTPIYMLLPQRNFQTIIWTIGPSPKIIHDRAQSNLYLLSTENGRKLGPVLHLFPFEEEETLWTEWTCSAQLRSAIELGRLEMVESTLALEISWSCWTLTSKKRTFLNRSHLWNEGTQPSLRYCPALTF